ncbi:hypothetical protein GIB67_019029 [Kingdonia uniflora]|uniref:Alpha/beta hydrolase fold-3 domain-containing protein n=1 Tax=Kingdonia uniflora TaxID=39325 RepID=A0A7J7MZR1_9MAGN|nr:hypothetical protein GIB67_019029 [Kingdonia uniflora]
MGKPVPMAKVECTIDPFEHLHVAMNPDGSLNRMVDFPVAPTISEDNVKPGQAYVSKDAPLNPENETWFRMYRPTKIPSNDNNVAKIPIILYFHTGGYILYDADTMFNNEPCGRFTSELPCILLSVNYRLAPEHRLPAAYDDAVELLYWLKQQVLDPNGDKWVRDYADLSRCYLMGCSSGANIAYRTGLCSTDLDIDPVKVSGIILNQPLFGGETRTKSEIRLVDDMVMPMSVMDLMWDLALPVAANRDHEYANPMSQGAYTDKIGKLPKVLIRGFEGDPLLDRQMELVRLLVKNGVQVTAHFGEMGFHCIDFIEPKRHFKMITYMKEFI